MSLAWRQGVKVRSLEILRHKVVEPFLILGWIELLCDGDTVCVLDVLQNLPSERSLADGPESLFQIIKILLGKPGELSLEALQIAEGVFVDNADESVKLQQRILEGRGSQQKLGSV